MKNLKELLFETLACLGGKRKKDAVEFLSPELLIRHKDAGIKYTVKKVGISKKDILWIDGDNKVIQKILREGEY